MLGAARTVQIAGWRSTGPANARRVGAADTNPSTTWTANGATTSTAQFEFGTASMYVADDNDDIDTTGGTRDFMDYGTGDFCIEFWVYFPTVGSGHSQSCDLLSNDTAGGFGCRFAREYNTDSLNTANAKYFNIFARGQADLDYWELASNWTEDVWHFCVIQRKGTDMCFWVDGELQTRSGSGGGTRNFSSWTNPIRIGTADGGNGVGEAYVDEVCFSNSWRYSDVTANIPVPTAAFTVDEYTTQLLHMDGSNGGTSFTNDLG